MRICAVPLPPPEDAGDHLLVSVDGGPWEAATPADPAAVALPEALRPDQVQRVQFAVWNPTDAPIALQVTAETPSGLAITPPSILIEAPERVAARSTVSGTVTVVTPLWDQEDWMGTRFEMPITIRAAGEAGPASGLARTGADPAISVGLALALLAVGAIVLLASRRRRWRAGGRATARERGDGTAAR